MDAKQKVHNASMKFLQYLDKQDRKHSDSQLSQAHNESRMAKNELVRIQTELANACEELENPAYVRYGHSIARRVNEDSRGIPMSVSDMRGTAIIPGPYTGNLPPGERLVSKADLYRANHGYPIQHHPGDWVVEREYNAKYPMEAVTMPYSDTAYPFTTGRTSTDLTDRELIDWQNEPVITLRGTRRNIRTSRRTRSLSTPKKRKSSKVKKQNQGHIEDLVVIYYI